MMLAVMDGMMPGAKIEKRSSAPPETVLTSGRMLLRALAKICARACQSIPGVGTWHPRRKTARAPAVKPTRLRNSGIRDALENPSSTEHLHGAARGGDRLPGARAERVGAHGEGVRQRPLAQALHEAALVHQAVRPEVVRAHRRAGREPGQLPDVDDGVGGARQGAEAALGEATLERHLAALVPGRAVAARSRPPSLVAARVGLDGPRGVPAPDAGVVP